MRATIRRRRPATRGLVASVAIVGLALTGTVTPAEASPAQQARRIAEATLSEVRAAASTQDARVRAETETPRPKAEGTVTPGKSATVSAGDLGVEATFSGNRIDSELRVTVGAAAPTALRAARSEMSGHGTVVSDPVEITATDGDGANVTRFPAKAVNTRGGGDTGPIVSDVVPGVALALEPDMALVEANGLDPATLRVYTRENAGEPWTALPSYFDTDAGVVRAESSHLSQFVVIGIPFPIPPGPVVVLDPDNDEGHATTPAPPVTELPFNMDLATRVQTLLTNDCRATVFLTRDASNPMVSRSMRAGIAASHDPDVTLGVAFNANDGTAWGDPTNGGSQVYSRGGALDDAVSGALVGVLPTYTGRPAKSLGNNGTFPGDEFAGLPNAFTHLEALFLDHNYDRPVIDGGMAHIANGVLTGLGLYLQSQGFDCSDPVTGGWPSPPTQAELQRWRDLGHQNYLTYGGDPVAFSTGNLVEDEKLFTLPGRGGQSTDITLTYNSQDGRLTRVGAGWSFGLGARAQRFSDGSVLVVRGDGASYVFAADGHGGFTGEAGLHQTLVESGGGDLTLKAVSGESWTFAAGDIDGIGELVRHRDAYGNTTTLGYGPADPKVNQFVPLTSITDSAGQTIEVSSDALGRVTAFTRPGGDRWTLSYDAAGDLTTITLPDGRTKSFTYDASHQLLTATDPTGAVYLKNEYDGAGRVAKQWDAEGNQRTFDYATAGQTTYTDNLGRQSVFAFDSRNRITNVTHPDGTTAAFTFDDQNNVTSSIDENGAETRYEYDAAGNLTTESAPGGRITRYTYTAAGDVATKTDRGGAKGAERTWSYDYDGAGRLVAIHQPDGTTVGQRYDAAGNLVASVQPSGATTAYGYDAAGNLTSRTDALGRTTTFAYDGAGRMVSQTDANGRTTSYAWDAGDRLVTVTDPAGGATSYGWESNDHVASITDPHRSGLGLLVGRHVPSDPQHEPHGRRDGVRLHGGGRPRVPEGPARQHDESPCGRQGSRDRHDRSERRRVEIRLRRRRQPPEHHVAVRRHDRVPVRQSRQPREGDGPDRGLHHLRLRRRGPAREAHRRGWRGDDVRLRPPRSDRARHRWPRKAHRPRLRRRRQPHIGDGPNRRRDGVPVRHRRPGDRGDVAAGSQDLLRLRRGRQRDQRDGPTRSHHGIRVHDARSGVGGDRRLRGDDLLRVRCERSPAVGHRRERPHDGVRLRRQRRPNFADRPDRCCDPVRLGRCTQPDRADRPRGPPHPLSLRPGRTAGRRHRERDEVGRAGP
ncbi:DUF6531 domain-containing protein [Leifsonia sp. McL0607]|uniref:RHS repeat domain-containing protein n=1 Tax=Leifsonia sp. McL0607 TaxID=3415672 RepID=UPI003CF927E2